jgi:hypothetical protein
LAQTNELSRNVIKDKFLGKNLVHVFVQLLSSHSLVVVLKRNFADKVKNKDIACLSTSFLKSTSTRKELMEQKQLPNNPNYGFQQPPPAYDQSFSQQAPQPGYYTPQHAQGAQVVTSK